MGGPSTADLDMLSQSDTSNRHCSVITKSAGKPSAKKNPIRKTVLPPFTVDFMEDEAERSESMGVLNVKKASNGKLDESVTKKEEEKTKGEGSKNAEVASVLGKKK